MSGPVRQKSVGVSVDPDAFLQAMALVPGPVTIIATGDATDRRGLTASSFSSLSADPPSVLVCINKSASAHDMILATGCFGVSVLPSDRHEVATLFVKKEIDRFAQHEWTTLKTGAPLLTAAAVAFDCRLIKSMDGFSHTIIIGQVEDMITGADDDRDCLIWHRRRFGRSAALVID